MVPHDPSSCEGTATAHRHTRRLTKMSIFIGAALGMAGCAAPSPEREAGLRGVGTPGVLSYPGEDQATTLQALLDRCRQVPTQPGPPSEAQSLSAACNQLHRTLHSQPGNTVEPGMKP